MTLTLCTPLLVACFSDTASSGSDAGATSNGSGSGSGTGGPGGNGTGNGGPGSDSGDPTDAGGGGGNAGLATEMIDDMEANTGSILATHGRVGAWYTYNDATAGATETPAAGVPFLPASIDPPRGTSHYASRMAGSGFTTWGAGMGFNLNDPGNGDGGSAKASYDASSYAGLVFWAKTASPNGAALRVNVSTKETDPAGGVCSPAAKCSDHFGKSLNVTSDWVQYVVKFSDLTQAGWGVSVPKFDAAGTYAVQFQVGKGTTFDVWVDDIAFLLK